MALANIIADSETCRYGAVGENSVGDSDDQSDDNENSESLQGQAMMTIKMRRTRLTYNKQGERAGEVER